MGNSLVHTAPVASNEKELGMKEDKKTRKEAEGMEKKIRPVGSSVKKTYAYDEAMKATREYFGGDDLAAKV